MKKISVSIHPDGEYIPFVLSGVLCAIAVSEFFNNADIATLEDVYDRPGIVGLYRFYELVIDVVDAEQILNIKKLADRRYPRILVIRLDSSSYLGFLVDSVGGLVLGSEMDPGVRLVRAG